MVLAEPLAVTLRVIEVLEMAASLGVGDLLERALAASSDLEPGR